MFRKGFTACAMATTLALSTTTVVLPPSIAYAQTSDAMPTNYFYTPAANADEYKGGAPSIRLCGKTTPRVSHRCWRREVR